MDFFIFYSCKNKCILFLWDRYNFEHVCSAFYTNRERMSSSIWTEEDKSFSHTQQKQHNKKWNKTKKKLYSRKQEQVLFEYSKD